MCVNGDFKKVIYFYREFEIFYDKMCCLIRNLKRNWNSKILWVIWISNFSKSKNSELFIRSNLCLFYLYSLLGSALVKAPSTQLKPRHYRLVQDQGVVNSKSVCLSMLAKISFKLKSTEVIFHLTSFRLFYCQCRPVIFPNQCWLGFLWSTSIVFFHW